MNWKKLILPPVAIYAVIFLFISALVGAKVNTDALWIWIVSLVITIVGLYLAVRYVKPSDLREGIIYGLVWVAVLVVLDLVLTAPFAGWDYFSSWKSYIPYALTILAPIALPQKAAQ